jgi:hypothetical protein
MPLFTYQLTDLTTFDSPPKQVWAEEGDLPVLATRLVREMLEVVPDLTNKGVCVTIFDQDGQAIKYVPLDTLQ